MKRFTKSGLTVAAFCEREKISASAFSEWKRKLGVRVSMKPRFVELTASPARPPASLPPQGEFELSLPGGVMLRWKA